jgi:anti-sigma B factor antagonist
VVLVLTFGVVLLVTVASSGTRQPYRTRARIIRLHHEDVTSNGCLEVRVERRDGVVVISPVGEVDLLAVPVLTDALADAVVDDGASVVVDLAGTDFFACCAVKVLAAAQAALSASGGSLELTGARGSVRKLLAHCDARGLLTRSAVLAR